MPNNQTKAITHGAMMIALFLILVAVAFYVPVINFIALIFAPLPLLGIVLLIVGIQQLG